MRFEDYVAARDDNGQQLDEAGLADMITGGVKRLGKALGLGGQITAQSAARARKQQNLANIAQSAENKEKAMSQATDIAKQKKEQDYNTIKQAQKEIVQLINNMIKLPEKLQTVAISYERRCAVKINQLVDIVKQLEYVNDTDKEAIESGLELFGQKINAYVDAVLGTAKNMANAEEYINAINDTLSAVSKNLLKFYNDIIRTTSGMADVGPKVGVQEFQPDQFLRKGETAPSASALPKPPPPAPRAVAR